MQFILICEDKADSEALRKANRDAHLAYIGDFDVLFAGPMLSDDGSTMIGSVICVEAEDRAAVDAFAAGDPYQTAGLFQTVTIRPFKRGISG